MPIVARTCRLVSLLAALTALVLAGCAAVTTTPAIHAFGAQDRVGAFNIPALTIVGPASQSSCLRPGSSVSAAGVAAGFCVAAEGSALTAAELGASREAQVAELTGGRVSGQIITRPNVESTDVDVVAPNGDYVAVGGPAKAANLSDLGHRLGILRYAAEQAGVGAQAYFEEGTPESALNVARRVLGPENVSSFPGG